MGSRVPPYSPGDGDYDSDSRSAFTDSPSGNDLDSQSEESASDYIPNESDADQDAAGQQSDMGTDMDAENTQDVEADIAQPQEIVHNVSGDAVPDTERVVFKVPETLRRLVAVEYPGKVRNAHAALERLGGLGAVASTSREPLPAAPALRLRLGPSENPFLHHVSGTRSDDDRVLVRIVQRRSKSDPSKGIYSIEIAGVVCQTYRFRELADFQYAPRGDNPLLKVARAMKERDLHGINAFSFPYPELQNEYENDDVGRLFETRTAADDDSSMKDLFPGPIFSMLKMSQVYGFRQAPGVSIVDQDIPGQRSTVQRYAASKTRDHAPENTTLAGHHISEMCSFSDKIVPTGENVPAEMDPALEDTCRKVRDLFAKRPVWKRTALLNQLDPVEVRARQTQRQIIARFAYQFRDGPFKGEYVRFGYDPRSDPNAAMLQYVSLRNLRNHRTRGGALGSAPAHFDDTARLSHIFDGKHLYGPVPAYQLCDINDTLIRPLLLDKPENRSRECSFDYGWWLPEAWDLIKWALRDRFFALYEGDGDADRAAFLTHLGERKAHLEQRKHL